MPTLPDIVAKRFEQMLSPQTKHRFDETYEIIRNRLERWDDPFRKWVKTFETT